MWPSERRKVSPSRRRKAKKPVVPDKKQRRKCKFNITQG